MSLPKRTRRPYPVHGDHRVFDNEDFVEFVIRGDASRDALASELSHDTQSVLEIGMRFAGQFFTIPGEFKVGSIEVQPVRADVDFMMRCGFTPDQGPAEDYGYVYFDFGFLFKPEQTGRERIRCVLFTIGVW